MRFRKDARLDPSRVEDYRGQGRRRVPGSMPWFIRGIEGSGPSSCDTFEGRV
jgi:hypothetical protein